MDKQFRRLAALFFFFIIVFYPSPAAEDAPLRELRFGAFGDGYCQLNRLVRQAGAECGFRVQIAGAAGMLAGDGFDGVVYAPRVDSQKCPGMVQVPESVGEMRFQVFAAPGQAPVSGWEGLKSRRVAVLNDELDIGRFWGADALALVPAANAGELAGLLQNRKADYAVMRLLPGNVSWPKLGNIPQEKKFRETVSLYPWLDKKHAALAPQLAAALRRAKGDDKTVAELPHILCIHSYHFERRWEEDITLALNAFLPENVCRISHEFLNANRNPLTAERSEAYYDRIRYNYRNEDIDLLLVLDDPALEFVKRHYRRFFAGVPVVFGGINNFRQEQIADFPLFTGVAEALPAAETASMLLRAHPNVRTLYLVNDSSLSGRAWQMEMENQIARLPEVASGLARVEKLPWATWEDLQMRVLRLPDDSALLFGLCATDSAGVYRNFAEGLAAVGKCAPVPIYSLTTLEKESGVIGGKTSNSSHQGQAMAEMALAVLDGTPPADIPVRQTHDVGVWEFDVPTMRVFGLTERQAESAVRQAEQECRKVFGDQLLVGGGDSEIFFRNRPENLARRYPLLFWSVLAGSFAAAGIIIFLLFYNRRQKLLNSRLAQQGRELRLQSDRLETQASLLENQSVLLKKQVDERNRILDGLAERMREVMRISLLSGAAPEGPDSRDALGKGAEPAETFAKFTNDIYAMFDLVAGGMRQLELLFSTMSSGFLLTEAVYDGNGEVADYRFLKANPAMEKLVGRLEADLMGKTCKELFPELREKWLPVFNDAAIRGKVRRLENFVPEFNRYLEMTVYSPRKGQCVCLLNDANERFQAVSELVKIKDAANEASQAKSSFLARMSHEIRTPMNAIIGLTHLLLSRELPGENRQYLEHILNASQSLLQQINDILDLSKIEAGKMQLVVRQFTMDSLLNGVMNILRPLAERKGLEVVLNLDSDVPECFEGDMGKIREVLLNLGGNAIKFTDKGCITVGCAVDSWSEGVRESDGKRENIRQYTLQFSVADSGCGISKEYLDRIFDPFTQEDENSTRAGKGTGLGLAICKNFVELMGGIIWVKSAIGLGSRFCFTVRMVSTGAAGGPKTGAGADARAGRAERAAPEDMRAFEKWSVLLVDDNSLNRLVATELLKQNHIRCDLAFNGREALDAVAGKPYDLIFMDVQMPEMDGYTATRKLREMGCRVPIVAMTAHAMDGDYKKSLEVGINFHISKPIDPQELRQVLGTLLCDFRPDARAETGSLDGENASVPETPPPAPGESAPAVLPDVPVSPETLPQINVADGLKYCDDDRELYQSLINGFAGEAPAEQEKLARAFLARDMETARRTAHSLKSLAATLGAGELSRLAAVMEKEVKNGVWTQDLHLQLQAEWKGAALALRRLRL